MQLTIKLVYVIVGIIVAVSLIGILLGVHKWSEGYKHDDPNKTSAGIKGMVVGGVVAAIASGVGAAIISQLNSITF